MAKLGTLMTYPNYYRGQKALIVGTLSNANFDVKLVSDDSQSGAITGAARLPVFKMDENKSLSDSNAICFLFANESLRGRSVEETTEVLQWMQFAEQTLLPPICAWIFPLIDIVKSDAKAIEKAKEDCLNILKVLDDHLLFRTFMLGDRITIADISVFCNLIFVYKHVFTPSLRRPFVCLNRWFKTLQGHPAVRQHVGELVWCETEAKVGAKEVKNKANKAKSAATTTTVPAAVSTEKRPFLKTKEELMSKLESLSIPFLRIDHRHVMTVDELMPELGTLPAPGDVGKNLFLMDKKTKKLYLLTAKWDREVKLKEIASKVGAKAELRLTDESVLLETLGVSQGCVTPFALINDSAGAVTFLLDSVFVPKGEADTTQAYFHPLTNDATLGVAKTDLIKFLNHVAHPPVVIDF